MCGICGIVSPNETPSLDLLQSMARTMHHRGPDDEGFHIEAGAALGFQRLSIIDLSGGHQPMASADGTLHIAFNGEIYNFRQLRQQLEATGRHPFKTNSDTEVILHLYQEYGEDCVNHMRGMFAFAIWDSKNKFLFIGRDRFGKKPLVYAQVGNTLLFASELRALLKHPAVKKDIHYPAIDLYLALQYIPSPYTIFGQIKKLPPAHCLTFKDGKLTIRRYWEPTFLPKTLLTFEDAQKAMMAKLKESVELRMIADVPLGAFLSGGKDSTTVVGLMSQLSKKPVQTFTIGFEEQTYSELPEARVIAKHFGCDHHEFIVKPDTVDILPKLAWHYGEPYADSSALPSYYVSKMTRQHVTVALNGDGGDETLAGYPRYQAMKFMAYWRKMPRGIRKAVVGMLSHVPDAPPPHAKLWRIKRLLSLGLDNPETEYLDTLCFMQEGQKSMLYTDFMKSQAGNPSAPTYINDFLEQAEDLPGIDRYLYTDLCTYLPECLMVKMDIASMANSLETRSPFLDHEFVELVATFPDSWKLNGLNHSKHILNQALKGWVPEQVLKKKKQGFAIPMSSWFRGPLKPYLESMLLSEKALKRGLFQKEGLLRMIEETATSRKDHSYSLWALLMLEHWFQAYID